MVNLYIQFGKAREQDPDFKVPEEEKEGFFSFRTFLIAYAAWITVPPYIRSRIAEQEAAGTWKATGITFFDDWVASTARGAQAVSDAAQSAAPDAVQTVTDTLDAVQSSGMH